MSNGKKFLNSKKNFFFWISSINKQTYFSSCTTAAHGRAKEEIHQQHDEEENAENDGQPQQPVWSDASRVADRWKRGQVWWIENEDCGCGEKKSFFGLTKGTTAFDERQGLAVALLFFHAFSAALDNVALDLDLRAFWELEHWRDHRGSWLTICRRNESRHNAVSGTSALINQRVAVVLLVEGEAVLHFNAIRTVRMIYFGFQLIVPSVAELADASLLVVELQHDVGIFVSEANGIKNALKLLTRWIFICHRTSGKPSELWQSISIAVNCYRFA